MELSPFAKGIALADRFDLDDLGAEFRHQACGEGSGDQGTDLKHPDTSERGSHLGYLFCSWNGAKTKSAPFDDPTVSRQASFAKRERLRKRPN
ncbi:hypothetical protein D9M71_200890 [compost metagenome]